MNLVFPELIYFDEYDGNFPSYFDAIYSVFHCDFIQAQPLYEGLKVSVRKYPEVEGMHRTFYHITHEGEDEANRQPDFRRMERIRFPKFVIENFEHDEILIWKNIRGKDERIVLFNEAQNYIVILTDRKEYYMFITAYYIETEHRKRKLLKEYEAYIKAKTA
ncbi:hypothetical protein [Sphingobacterium thalpophilum]|uniref:Phage P1-related protein n=1 Tax=Sphingobacterium thalpophilum TaxID=259 RepID=A0A4U9VC36_9SPHI|nr:hypothetical protein [Sphingobacterium thalpophilum]VTR43603.1 Uncharacterised protein [Sphingobacterium thalpophilum]